MAEDNINNGNNAINVVPKANRALRDYAVPLLQGLHQSIKRPSINVNNFEINPAYIQMIQSSVQFSGLLSDDLNAHLVNFLEICNPFKYNGVTDDAIRLRLFPFSLRDKAKSWLNSLPNRSITTWEDLAQKFLAKFFPLVKTGKLRNDITSFTQFDGESLDEAWERFKEQLRRCPHHGIPDWLQVQTFYNGLVGSIKTTIDAAAKGALMSKNVADAYNLLEEMVSNNYQRPSERSSSRKAVGAYEIDTIGNLAAFQQQSRPLILEKKSQVEELILQYMSKTDAIIQSYGASLRNLETQMGQLANSINSRPQGALQSDTQVNPKGKEHCNAITLRSGKEVEGVNGKSIESLKEHVDDDKAIVEKEVEVEKIDNGQAKNQRNSEANYPPPPFPQRLKKQKLDKQFEKFLNVFKKLHINIPFDKALETCQVMLNS
ncbi:Retrotransposon gag domain - like 10 [Theobroma cacao]|nr:Retrotransposon gag domain - like 10 [Theobroma cacao]